MNSFFLLLLAHMGTIAVIVAVYKRFKPLQLDFRWVIISVALFTSYFVILIYANELFSIKTHFPDLRWNWAGKLGAIALWLASLAALIKFKSDFSIRDAGFTFKQNENSVKPALAVTASLIALMAAAAYFGNRNVDANAETLWFQLLMPGFDEEPMFRGIVLYTLSLAIVTPRFKVLGAQMNFAGLLIVLLFGLVHGVAFNNGEFTFSPVAILVTGAAGFVLLWLREKTGSLVFPVLAHNGVNFVAHLF